MSFIKEMYWFDGYSTPITHLVLGAYFTIPEERRSESFQYAPAPWAIAIVVFLSPITNSIYNFL